jgi:hypothetical protein
LQALVESLDARADAIELHRLGLRPACVATLRICTELLQTAVRAGLTLQQTAALVERGTAGRVLGLEEPGAGSGGTAARGDSSSPEGLKSADSANFGDGGLGRCASPLERAVVAAVNDAGPHASAFGGIESRTGNSTASTGHKSLPEQPPDGFYAFLRVRLAALVARAVAAAKRKSDADEEKWRRRRRG